MSWKNVLLIHSSLPTKAVSDSATCFLLSKKKKKKKEVISPTVSSLPLPQLGSGPPLGNQQEGAARTPSSLPLSLHLFSSRTWHLRLGTELGGINRKDSDCFGYPLLDNKLPPKQFIFSLQFCGSSDLGWLVLLCQSCSLAWLHL